jgi:hypothetical protein
MARWKTPSLLEDERERRRQYKGRLIERRADGGTGGVDPRHLDRALLEQVHPPAPILDVIREKCLDCSGYQPGEVDRCTAIACSLWPYRFGTNPFSNRKGNAGALQMGRSRSAVPVQAEEISTDDEARHQGAPEPVIALERQDAEESSSAPGGAAGALSSPETRGKGSGAS